MIKVFMTVFPSLASFTLIDLFKKGRHDIV